MPLEFPKHCRSNSKNMPKDDFLKKLPGKFLRKLKKPFPRELSEHFFKENAKEFLKNCQKNTKGKKNRKENETEEIAGEKPENDCRAILKANPDEILIQFPIGKMLGFWKIIILGYSLDEYQ